MGGPGGEPQVKAYEWRFPVADLNKIITRLVDIPGNGGFSGLVKSGYFSPDGSDVPTLKETEFTYKALKFEEADDLLGQIDHSWEFGISLVPYPELSTNSVFVSILLWVKDTKNTISVPPEVEVHMCRGHLLNSRGIVKLNSEEKSGYQGFKGWLFSKKISSSTWSSPDNVKVIFKFKYLHLPASGPSEPPGVPNPFELNIKKHFLSEFLSDVKLVSGGQEFPAHRFVLACKSPVFERMFQNSMKETVEGRVEIGDMEPNILKEMLSYIYTGEFTGKTVSEDVFVCMEVYKSADKYGFQDLKIECTREIAKRVAFENALDVYVLGRMTEGTILIEKALEVMKMNKAKFLRDADTLSELAKRYPELAFELASMPSM